MSAELAVVQGGAGAAERNRLALSAKAEAVICSGDLTPLNDEERVTWYKMRCESVGLDFRTQPFLYTKLNNKLVLYPTKTATEQLCADRHISTQIIERRNDDGAYTVLCRASLPDGQFTESTGVVWVKGLTGEALCNSYMKCETKSKRRAVLSLTGLGMLDETELETIPGAVYPVNPSAETVTVKPTHAEARAQFEAKALETYGLTLTGKILGRFVTYLHGGAIPTKWDADDWTYATNAPADIWQAAIAELKLKPATGKIEDAPAHQPPTATVQAEEAETLDADGLPSDPFADNE